MMNQLIDAIEKRRGLWDHSHPEHRHNSSLTNLWWEVAAEVKLTVKQAKTKWRRLRESFKHKIMKLYSAGVPIEHYHDKWLYFHHLKFLLPHIIPAIVKKIQKNADSADLSTLSTFTSKTIGTKKHAEDDSFISASSPSSYSAINNNTIEKTITDSNEDTEGFISENFSDSDYEDDVEFINVTYIDPKTVSQHQHNSTSLNNDKKKTTSDKFSCGQDSNDDADEPSAKRLKMLKPRTSLDTSSLEGDIAFFKSLYPLLEKMDPRKKVHFRMKVLEFLNNEMEDEERNETKK